MCMGVLKYVSTCDHRQFNTVLPTPIIPHINVLKKSVIKLKPPSAAHNASLVEGHDMHIVI